MFAVKATKQHQQMSNQTLFSLIAGKWVKLKTYFLDSVDCDFISSITELSLPLRL